MEKIYSMHKLVGLQLFLSGTPIFSSGTPTFCQMGVLNSCFQNPSESSVRLSWDKTLSFPSKWKSLRGHYRDFPILGSWGQGPVEFGKMQHWP